MSTGLPWYAGGGGAAGLLRAAAGLRDDLDTLRRGFRWEGPRPASWPERSPVVPDRASNLGWARAEPVRTLRDLLQRTVTLPVNRVMANPTVEGREYTRNLERPVIFASNHVSHADTPLLLGAMSDRAREHTVVAAAADYFYRRPNLGRFISLWLNTFPFSRTGGAQAVLHSSGELLRSGWNLLVFPEGTRSPDGRLQPFRPGVGHLATENRTPVVPMHIDGTHRVMPKGRKVPLPAPVRVRIGKPLTPGRAEPSRAFAERVEAAVQSLAAGRHEVEVTGGWIDRWRAGAPRSPRYRG